MSTLRQQSDSTVENGGMIEVAYYRYGTVYIADDFETVEGALAFIEGGEDDGQMSTVGVFRDGEPIIHRGYVDQLPPTPEQAEDMRENYRRAKARLSPTHSPSKEGTDPA